MKQVRETAAGKSISAWVIINKKNVHIATVQAHFGNSEARVDVWGIGTMLHQGKAGGYGYDKMTAAMAGAVIDGIKLYDHCGGHNDKAIEKALAQYNKDKTLQNKIEKRLGARFTNWSSEKQAYTSLYYCSGLDRLSALGYRIIQAI